jgi:putative transcriptional regulator
MTLNGLIPVAVSAPPILHPNPRKTTRRGFDTLALTPVETMSGPEILALREREGISQAVLALYLNVRTKLVSDWERGVKHPSGPSLKLLALIRAKGVGAIA